jgi:hypothetical protein
MCRGDLQPKVEPSRLLSHALSAVTVFLDCSYVGFDCCDFSYKKRIETCEVFLVTQSLAHLRNG